MHNSCERAERLQKYQSTKNDVFELEKQSSSKRNDAVVQPVVEDPVEEDRIPAEVGAAMIPTPCEPSEIPIPTMVHIMRQRQSTG